MTCRTASRPTWFLPSVVFCAVSLPVAVSHLSCASETGTGAPAIPPPEPTAGTFENTAPVADAGADTLANEHERVSLDASLSTDSDGTIVSFRWTQRPSDAPPVALEGSNTVRPSFTVPDVMEDAVFVFDLEVRDDDGASETDDVRVQVSNPDRPHNIIMRVVRDWTSYHSAYGGWPSAVRIRESEWLKYFEAAIWEETDSVHLYEFDSDFDPLRGGQPGMPPERAVAHREAYRISRATGLPPAGSPARSRFLQEAFTGFAEILAARYPDSDHHFMYSGHGGPGGALFAAHMRPPDANRFLASWTAALGRHLGVIDMGGPCNKGSFSDLKNFCGYSRYYIASDLTNGGYRMDRWTMEKHRETDPEEQYHTLFSRLYGLREVLAARLDLRQLRYEYSRNDMIRTGTMQANYLYSCWRFAEFAPGFENFLDAVAAPYDYLDDLFEYMVEHSAPAESIDRFHAVTLHSVHNRDFFEWPERRHGILMPTE